MSDAKNNEHELSAEELAAIEEKYDEAAATRPVSEQMHKALRFVAITFAIYHFLTAGFALPAEHWHMGWHLAGLFHPHLRPVPGLPEQGRLRDEAGGPEDRQRSAL